MSEVGWGKGGGGRLGGGQSGLGGGGPQEGGGMLPPHAMSSLQNQPRQRQCKRGGDKGSE